MHTVSSKHGWQTWLSLSCPAAALVFRNLSNFKPLFYSKQEDTVIILSVIVNIEPELFPFNPHSIPIAEWVISGSVTVLCCFRWIGCSYLWRRVYIFSQHLKMALAFYTVWTFLWQQVQNYFKQYIHPYNPTSHNRSLAKFRETPIFLSRCKRKSADWLSLRCHANPVYSWFCWVNLNQPS